MRILQVVTRNEMRGAEVFVHSTSEAGSPSVSTKELARRARAAENLAYVVSANSASLEGIPVPAQSTSGMSKIVDYYGQIMAEASPGGESMVANAFGRPFSNSTLLNAARPTSPGTSIPLSNRYSKPPAPIISFE